MVSGPREDPLARVPRDDPRAGRQLAFLSLFSLRTIAGRPMPASAGWRRRRVSEGSWGPDPVSTELLGDSGPWVWSLPTFVQALNDPRGPWSPPPAPWTSGARQGSAFADAIAYWAPLTR